MPSNHLILCCPLLLLPFPASGSFQMSQSFTSRPKYWSFSFNISSFNEYSGLISFRMKWLDLLAVQGTLKSLLQHHAWFKSINSSALSFLYSPTSHPYMTTGKTIALTRWNFVDKVMTLLFNMLSRSVITFLTRRKCFLFLISQLQSVSAVILEAPPKNKVCHCFSIYLP